MNLLDADPVERIRTLSHKDGAFRSGWEKFGRRMEQLAADGVGDYSRMRSAFGAGGPGGFTAMNLLRFAVQDAARLAFWHRVTGSGAAAGASALMLGWLLEVPEWRAQGVRNGWDSDLWTADLAAAAACAMDFLGGSLPAGDRAAIAAAIRSRGIEPIFREWLEPATRIHALDSMGHNWWSVCVSGAVAALFAVAEDGDAGDARRLALAGDAIGEFFRFPGNILQNKQPTFGRQGDFIESVGYLDYTLERMVFVLDLYRARLGRDLAGELPVLARVCDYYMACVQPLRDGLQRINFGDMGSGPDTVGSYAHNPSGVWLWLSREFRRPDLFRLVERTHPEPDDIFPFLFWPSEVPAGGFEHSPGDCVFENTGVAVLRDGYGDLATVFAIKTGEKWNHNQSDAGSFILSSRGVEFFTDPGTTGYSDPLHASYFKRGFAHNVVLHSGRDQLEDLDHVGTKFMGRIAGFLRAPGYKYVLADATGPWEGIYRRFYRHVLWLGGAVILIDDLMAFEPGAWTSLYHYAGEARLTGGGFDVVHRGEVLRAHLVSPRPESVDFATGHFSRQKTDRYKYLYETGEAPYLRAHYPSGGVRAKLLTVLELPGGSGMRVEGIESENLSGVRLHGAEGSTEILCNHLADGSVMHLNSFNAHGEIRTDAFLAVIFRDAGGRPVRFGLHNGSRLEVAGRAVYDCLLKGDVVFSADETATVLASSLSAASRVSVAGLSGCLRSARVPEGPAETVIP